MRDAIVLSSVLCLLLALLLAAVKSLGTNYTSHLFYHLELV